MTAEDLDHLHTLLTARVMANRLTNTRGDFEVQLAAQLLSTLQGSSRIIGIDYNRGVQECVNHQGEVVGKIHHGATTYTFTIESWN